MARNYSEAEMLYAMETGILGLGVGDQVDDENANYCDICGYSHSSDSCYE